MRLWSCVTLRAELAADVDLNACLLRNTLLKNGQKPRTEDSNLFESGSGDQAATFIEQIRHRYGKRWGGRWGKWLCLEIPLRLFATPPLNKSGSKARMFLRISRSCKSSGVSLARAPCNVTLR
jgi:hypothetical protein